MSTDIFSAFATNERAELEGTPVRFGTVEFLIARAYNANFNRVFSKRYRDVEDAMKAMSPEDAEKVSTDIMIDCMAQTVLVGWRGEVKFQGQDLGDYSVDKARKLLALKDFRVWVSRQADNLENYRLQKEEAAQKN